MKYKQILILSYLNTMKSSYSYTEISEIFGLTIKQIEDSLDDLEENAYINLDKYYKLTDKGRIILESYNLENVDFFETMGEVESVFTKPKLNIDDIYIPKKFLKKI